MEQERGFLRTVDITDRQDLPAGDFSTWLGDIQNVLTGDGVSDVPCAGCNACCRSSNFIHIGPGEAETRHHVPSALLFPAPGYVDGTSVLGFDERGCCPMLAGDECSIYDFRPMACRAYDCRLLSAAGLANDPRAPVAQQTQRWRFDYGSPRSRLKHAAIRAAAAIIARHPECTGDEASMNGTQVAILAVKAHNVLVELHEECVSAGHIPTDQVILNALTEALQSR